MYLVGFVQVPLRYPILPMCSRSAIWDEISINGIFTYAEAPHVCLSLIGCLSSHPPQFFFTLSHSRKYPLYSRGVDKKSFDIGVFLLNKDLEQVRSNRSI